MNQCQLFCKFPCTHVEDNQKVTLARNSMFFMHLTTTQMSIKVNIEVISILMMLDGVKVQKIIFP